MQMNFENLMGRIKTDIKGSMATTFALSLMATTFAIGSAYDFSQVAKARSMAQNAADMLALAASISVDQHNSDRYNEGQSYPYSSFGGPSHDFTNSMSGLVQYDIVDDQDPNNADKAEGDKSRLIARATVSGVYKPAFLGMMPTHKRIPFKVTSDVAYSEKKGTPASVFFVVDNSGSMGWDDDSGTEKMVSLKASLKSFMTTIDGMDGAGNDLIRTGLYPYSADQYNSYATIDSDGVIPGRQVAPKWGRFSDANVNAMDDLYGTDPSGSLEDTKEDFATELAAHQALNPNTPGTPLKFLVYMTDGANNETHECVTESVTTTEVVSTVVTPGYWWRNHWWYGYQETHTQPSFFSLLFGGWTYVPPVTTEEEVETTNDVTTCDWGFHIDARSLAHCTEMKNAGVKIFTIAYDIDDNPNTWWNEETHGETYMQACSSGGSYHKSASDGTALQAAFDAIGDAIATEVIRIKR